MFSTNTVNIKTVFDSCA